VARLLVDKNLEDVFTHSSLPFGLGALSDALLRRKNHAAQGILMLQVGLPQENRPSMGILTRGRAFRTPAYMGTGHFVRPFRRCYRRSWLHRESESR
jgi:hypothetical protein